MSGRTTKIVVFGSGRGTNFRSLCEAKERGQLSVSIEAFVTNVCGVPACDVARAFGIPVIEVPVEGKAREAHETQVLSALKDLNFEWIVLAGYMRLFSEKFVNRFFDERRGCARIVNIHPSLLPAFAGKNGYAQALEYGVKIAGTTVHLVGAGLDDGPIVAQRAFEVREDDTEETLTRRGLLIEHELYANTLERLVTEPWVIGAGPTESSRPRVVFQGGTIK